MNESDRIRYWAHMLDEAMRLDEGNQAVIADIEASFGDWIWQDGLNFRPNNLHIKQMFRIINKHIFGGELDENVRKIVKPESECEGGEKMAMAMFTFGWRKGETDEYIGIVRHDRGDNFFITFNSLIHEMIHMYDYHFGPMGKQFSKWGAVGCYNWNYPHPAFPVPGWTPTARIAWARTMGFDAGQLPDELGREIPNSPRINAQAHPRQYQFPADVKRVRAPDGAVKEVPAAQRRKYSMDQLDGFYDVHGGFFQQLADHANRQGFSVDDVFYAGKTYRMRRVDEDPDETPEDLRYMSGEALVRNAFDRIKDPGKRLDYTDPDNMTITLI